jgi:hypothetical protein
MTDPGFKPSDVVLLVPPLTDTMRKAEVEQAAALIVYVCTVKGDAWQPMTWNDLQAAIKVALDATEPTAREQWLRAIIRNPFVRPDVHELCNRGFAEKLSKEGEQIVVQLLPTALEAIAKRWVRRAGDPGLIVEVGR